MRVLLIDPEPTWRGGEQQALYLIQGLLRRGVEAHLAADPGGELHRRAQSLCPLAPLKTTADIDIRGWPRILLYCARNRIDVLDAHNARAHLIGFFIRLLLPRIRLVVHRHVDFRPAWNVINPAIYRVPLVDRFVAVSENVARILEAFGVNRNRVSVVRSCVDPAPFERLDRELCRRRLREQIGLAAGTAVIGAVGQLEDHKDHATLVRALGLLRDRGLDFHCALVGEGSLRPGIEAQIAQAGLERYVSLMGFRRDVPEILTGLDVFVMSSYLEGLGTAVQEACHASACVVATSAGGIPEMITHEQTGLLSPPSDEVALAANLRRALEDPQLRARLASCAHQQIAARFRIEDLIENNLGVYREVMSERLVHENRA